MSHYAASPLRRNRMRRRTLYVISHTNQWELRGVTSGAPLNHLRLQLTAGDRQSDFAAYVWQDARRLRRIMWHRPESFSLAFLIQGRFHSRLVGTLTKGPTNLVAAVTIASIRFHSRCFRSIGDYLRPLRPFLYLSIKHTPLGDTRSHLTTTSLPLLVY